MINDSQKDHRNDANEILKVKRKWPLAMQSLNPLEFDSILSRDFIFKGGDKLFTRSDYIKNRTTPDEWKIIFVKYDNVTLQFFGDTGILSYVNHLLKEQRFMNNEYPNPWNFSNTDKNLLSPTGKYKIEFGDLYEIAMGAPIGGTCYLISDNKKLILNDWCGGPIIWNETIEKVALPVWTRHRNQKIAIVDITGLSITTFKKEFRVLHFKKFLDNNLFGIDSPIYRTTSLNFDIEKEEIETIKQLK